MSITFKPVVYAHHKKADGTYNVKIRVTHKRIKRHMATNIFVKKEDMTRGLKIKSQNVLDELKGIVEHYQRIAGTIPAERAAVMSVDDVLQYINTYTESHSVFELDFMEFGRRVVAEYREAGRSGSALSYETTLHALERFLRTDKLPIQQLTVRLLEDFSQFLAKEPVQTRKKGVQKGGRAQSLYLGNIRILHNKAKDMYNDEDAGIIRIPNSPFKKFKIPKQPITRKRSITVEQLKAIMMVPDGRTMDSRQTLARDVFLLSFGLIGMNSVDLYSCTQYSGKRITYQRSKTRDRRADNAQISILVEPCVLPLVEKYRDKSGKRVFNFYKRYSDHRVFNAALNKGLKQVGGLAGIDGLEFYAARHTWATLARNKAGIDKETIHEALNHVDDNMRITDIYIDKDYSLQDAANRKVLELVEFSVK